MFKIINFIKGNEKIRFLFSGGLNTVLSYFEVILLDIFLAYQVAYTLSVIIGLIQGFFLHKYISFRSDEKPHKEIGKFIVVAILSYLIGLGLLYMLMEKFHVISYVSFFINSLVCAVTSYFGHKFISFRKR